MLNYKLHALTLFKIQFNLTLSKIQFNHVTYDLFISNPMTSIQHNVRELNKRNIFWDSFNLWCPLLIIVLYHQIKTSICFWCRKKLNPRSLIQLLETLPVELTWTHNKMNILNKSKRYRTKMNKAKFMWLN